MDCYVIYYMGDDTFERHRAIVAESKEAALQKFRQKYKILQVISIEKLTSKKEEKK